MSDADEMVAFLLAQYDKDEQTARATEQAESACLTAYAEDLRVTVTESDLTNRWRVSDEEDQSGGWSITAGTYTEIRDGRTQVRPWIVAGPGYTGGGVGLRESAEHIARHDPHRVLAEVAAKREVIRLYEDTLETIEMLKAHGQKTDAHEVAAESYLNVIRAHVAAYSGQVDRRHELRSGAGTNTW